MEEKKIFVSYSRYDAKFAIKLALDLREAGLNIWLDQLNIPIGQNWDTEIENALTTSDTLLLIASENSVISDNVLNELNFAIEEGKKVIPVIATACKLPFRIKRLQHIDLTRNYESGFLRLLEEYNKTSEKSKTKSESEQELNRYPQFVKIAPLGFRFAAAFLDSIVYIPSAIIWEAFYQTYYPTLPNHDYVFPATLTLLLYLILTEGLSGQTIGKRILKIKVVKVDFKKVSLIKSAIRHSFDIVDLILFVGLFVASANKERQRVGDFVAKTMVILKE